MIRLKIFTSLTVFFAGAALFAQQDAMFTHYMYNTQAVNPGYAGSRQALTVTGLHRSQWVGFDGAPVTQTLTLHTPFIKENFGVGLSFVNDKIGPVKTTAFYADFAYHLKISEKGKLAFGLKAGGSIFNSSLTGLKLDQAGDNNFATNVQSKFLPNAGFGVYYYTPTFYVGLSAPKLLENDLNSGAATKLGTEQRHYFLIAGTVIKINSDLSFKPTTFLKVTNGAPVELDLTANFLLKEKFSLGAMYRTGDALGLLLGYNFTEQLMLGYSFDWSFLNTTGKYNSGSHEIMLRYDFLFKTKEKIKSPRYF